MVTSMTMMIVDGSADAVLAGIVDKLESLPALSTTAVETPANVPNQVMPAGDILAMLDEWAVLLESQMAQMSQGRQWVDGLWLATAVPADDYVVGL